MLRRTYLADMSRALWVLIILSPCLPPDYVFHPFVLPPTFLQPSSPSTVS